MSSKGPGALRRDAFKNSGHSKSFGLSKAGAENAEKFQMKPKIIAILRSGLKPRKAVRVLLNNRQVIFFQNFTTRGRQHGAQCVERILNQIVKIIN